jgi:hypothetical protein
MAIESQGIQIRRIGTAITDAITWHGTAINIKATCASCGNASFVTEGYTTGMRVMVTGGAQNATQIFTIKALSSVRMSFYQPAATAEDATGLTLVGNAYTNVGEVTGFNGPSGAANVIDVTNLQSTAKEKMIGLRDEGQVTIDVNLNASSGQYQMAMKDDRANRIKRQYEIVLTDASTALDHIPTALNFDAYVSGFSITGSVDNIVKGSITLEITSAVKWIAEGS